MPFPPSVSTLDQVYGYLRSALHPTVKKAEDRTWWYDMRTQMQKGKYDGHIPHEKFKAENPAWVMKQAEDKRRVARVFLEGNKPDSYLMQKAITDPTKVRLPGGGIEKGETPMQAAMRELQEEFQIKIPRKNIKYLGKAPDRPNEYYFHLKDHGLKPGTYTAMNKAEGPYAGGVEKNTLVYAKPSGKNYWGPEPGLLGLKKADWTEWDLQKHQERVAKRMADKNTEGLVVAHGMGSGKTLSSLATYERLGMPTTVVPPAALVGNYQKEIGKWIGKQPKDLQIESQQRAALRGLQHDPKNGLLIVDEAHRARENESKLLAALNQSEAKKRMLLTGTPIVNHPRDLSTLVNFVANKHVLPDTPGEFNKQYFQPTEVAPGFFQRLAGVKPGLQYRLKNQGKLRKILDKYVDYYPGATAGYPTVKQEEVKVPMGSHQMDIYKVLMKNAPWWVRWKVKSGLPPGKGELEKMQAFLTGVRQVSNTNREFTKFKRNVESPKIDQAFNYLNTHLQQDPSYKALVYSNYLKSGLEPYKQQLDKNKIPYGEFSGEIDSATRNQLVKNYNKNKLRALLVSSAGAEGLDLQGTRLIQLLEPHYNLEKEKQIIGRGVRYMSHAKLPPEKRNVLVQRYFATPKASWFDKLMGHPEIRGADQYIHGIADRKEQMNRQVMSLMNPEEKKKQQMLMPWLYEQG